MLKVFTFMCATFAVVIGLKNYNYNEYRNLRTCEGRPHTFYVYQSEKPAPACFRVLQTGLTDEDKKSVLDLHNSWRQKVAIGAEKRGNPGPQPPARVMEDLIWDEELEDMAQRWANQCNHRLDQCRDSVRFKVNQSGVGWNLTSEGQVNNLKELLDGTWGHFVEQFHSNAVLNYSATRYNYTHNYAQIVWADTKYVGCGAIKYTIPHSFYFEIICNYGPAGDIDGKPVYLTF